MRRRSHTALAGIAVVAMTAAGCGGAESSTTTSASESAASAPSPAPSEAVVSLRQIDRSTPGSPERTVLEWWRDVQLNEPEHARRLYVEPPSLPDLAGQFNFVAGWLDGSVEVVGDDRDGSRAVALVRWTRPDGEARRIALRLEEHAGGWKLRDARFVDAMVDARRSVEGGE